MATAAPPLDADRDRRADRRRRPGRRCSRCSSSACSRSAPRSSTRCRIAGGQCVELYADKPIYDIPALPFATGRELVERLLKQIAPFGAGFHLGQQVSAVARARRRPLRRRHRSRHALRRQGDRGRRRRRLVPAAPAEDRRPRRLSRAAAVRSRRRSAARASPAQRVVIVGNGEAAVAAALDGASKARRGASVTLVHRRDDFDAADADARRACARCAPTGRDRASSPAQPSGDRERRRPPARASSSTPTTAPRAPAARPAARAARLEPEARADRRLGPGPRAQAARRRHRALRDLDARASIAVGDVNTYPGKQKLIVCGFHEATLAAFAIAERVHPDRAQPLQYTTTSPKLHRLLGVDARIRDRPSLR